MPTLRSPSSGYRYWVLDADVNNPAAPRLEFINIGQWQCSVCYGVVSELPETTFDTRATGHLQGHQP
jgi:hypothetical protein